MSLHQRFEDAYRAQLREMGFVVDRYASGRDLPNHPELRRQAKAEVKTALAAEVLALRALVCEGPLVSLVQAAVDALRQDRPGSVHECLRQYEEARLQLLDQRLKAAGLAICRDCRQAKSDVTCVVLDGRGVGGASDCMSRREWFVRYWRLTQLCQPCQTAAEELEQRVTIRGSKPNTTFCHVRPTKVRHTRCFYRVDDQWRLLPTEVQDLTSSIQSTEATQTALGVPPKLALDRYSNDTPCLVIERGYDRDDNVPLFERD